MFVSCNALGVLEGEEGRHMQRGLVVSCMSTRAGVLLLVLDGDITPHGFLGRYL